MRALTPFRRYAQWLLALLCIIAIASGVLAYRDGPGINTDLKSLSPAIARDQVINQTLDQMSSLAASQIILVLTHPDADLLETANETLLEKIEDLDTTLTLVDRTPVIDDYRARLTRAPFTFLDTQARNALAQQSDEQLLARAKAKLYGSASGLRLIPLQSDPMGWVNDYALQAIGALGGISSEESASATIAGQDLFYTAHTLKLTTQGLDMNAQSDVMATLEKLESELTQDYSDLRFLHSGIFFFASDAAANSKKDISFITTGSALGVALLVLLLFRSVKALLLPVVSIVSGSVFAFFVCQALFGSLHIFTLVFGASLIGVVIDYSLHFFYVRGRGSQATDDRLYRALLLSLFTSVIGYSALSWSGLDALKQVAFFSGAGLIFAWLIVVTLGPYLSHRLTIHDLWLAQLVHGALRACAQVSTRQWLFGSFILAVVLLIASGGQLLHNDSPRALFAPNPTLLEQEQQVSALTADYEPGSFVLIRAQSAQAVYDLTEVLQRRLSEASGELLGAHQFFPSPVQASQNYALNQRLYDDKGNSNEGKKGLALEFMRTQGFDENVIAALQTQYAQGEPDWLSPAAFFAQHSGELPPLWVEQNQAITGKEISSFLLIPKQYDLTLLQNVAAELEGVFFISAVAETTTALGQLRQTALWLLLVALGLIYALMVFRYRSIMTALRVTCVPAIALAGTLVCFAALGVSMTLFHAMALFLVLGLGMDYVIFVAEMDENVEQTLAAIVLSATTSLLSFGLLSASDLPAVSGFGLTVLIGNSLNLFGSLVLASRPTYRHVAHSESS